MIRSTLCPKMKTSSMSLQNQMWMTWEKLSVLASLPIGTVTAIADALKSAEDMEQVKRQRGGSF